MRVAYLSAQTRTKLSNQIRTLRTDRGWSQGDFARILSKPQSNVSRLENRQYGKFNLTTLFEVASACDVGLVVKFVTYEEFLRDTEDLSEAALRVRGFDLNALRELCEDFVAPNDITIWDGRHPELMPSGNTLARIHTPIVSMDPVIIGPPITIGMGQPLGKSWAGLWDVLRPLSNSSTYQIRMPSAQDEEIARLQHALAQSEREKGILQKEYAALRAKLEVMPAHQTQALNESMVIPPAFMLNQTTQVV